MAALRSSDPAEQRRMLNARGVEVAAFLLWLIKTQSIQPIEGDGDGGRGGLGLLAWSWGNTITMSFLAQATKLSKEDQETLRKYLRALIFFGTPTLNCMRKMPADESNYADSSSHGFGVPSDLTDYIVTPLRDPQIPLELKGISFER